MNTSFRNYAGLLVAMLLILTIVISCGKAPSKSANAPAPMMSIYDTIIIASTDAVMGERTDLIYSFDFSNKLASINGQYDDLFIGYGPTFGVEFNNWIWDTGREAWDQFSEIIPGFWYHPDRGIQHSILGVGLKMREYIDDSSYITIKADPYFGKAMNSEINMNVTAVRYHPGYQPIYLSYRGFYTPYHFAFDGESYWMKTDSNIIVEMTQQGDVIEEHVASIQIGNGFTALDNGFAHTYGDDSIIILDENFSQICGIHLPEGYLYGLAWGNGKLWAAHWHGLEYTTILGIDIDSSCQLGEIVITDSLPTDYYLGALAFDGNNLLALRAMQHPSWLYQITTTGEVIDSIVPPVEGLSDMQIHDGILHVICSGPRGLGTTEKLITRFKMGTNPNFEGRGR